MGRKAEKNRFQKGSGKEGNGEEREDKGMWTKKGKG